jgi:hypothetical protein
MWSVEYLPAAADERAELPVDMRARLGRMTDVIGHMASRTCRAIG